MQSTSEGMNIAELANQLRREKILIMTERQILHDLNEEVEKNSLELLQVAWICSQQRQNLINLITSRSESDSIVACQRATLLEHTSFIDAFKVLKYKEAIALGELLGWLRDSPHLVSLCLLLAEENMPPSLPSSLVAGLYGSCRSHSDQTRLLAVIRSLIKHQLVPSSDPRKLIRNGKCALSSLYGVFRDGHPPARHFLVAALRAPVMAVLQEDEYFLDIDLDKCLERFSSAELVKKFGEQGGAEYASKVAMYRKWVAQSLYNLAVRFVRSLTEHWATFPAAIAWIVQQIDRALKHHGSTSEEELHAICSDLVLTQYICPALVNPETQGVVDLPVSYVARFNLIQIAHALQTLSLAKYREIEPKTLELYDKFERACMWSLVERVRGESGAPVALAAGPASVPAPPPGASNELPAPASVPAPPSAGAAAALYTAQELAQLLTLLKRSSSRLDNNTASITSEDLSASSAPPDHAAPTLSSSGSSSSSCGSSGGDSGGETARAVERLAAALRAAERGHRGRLQELLRRAPAPDRLGQLAAAGGSPPDSTPNGRAHPEHKTAARAILSKVSRTRRARDAGEESAPLPARPEVLLIRLASEDDRDYIGLVPESKVLECYYGGGSEAGDADDAGVALAASAATGPAVQKRTRFSLSHDEVSLGNTSDNLEAVSEAASNHSVTSSLELETEDQNDNLSDMVSANVSGRGSPNISGRETPSSQVTDGDAPGDYRRAAPVGVGQAGGGVGSAAGGGGAGGGGAPGAGSTQAKMLKQTRNDIEDKFCKFEIKKLLEGDETVSIMSDTWSTDVLASDSETIGDTCEHAPSAPTLAHGGVPAGVGVTAGGGASAPDVSETASESAWSMDVLASDSDRNTEVDTDDCVSVAARSDSSWPRRLSHHDDCVMPAPATAPARIAPQVGPRRADAANAPAPAGSPRHSVRQQHLINRSGGGYLTATAALSRGGELDLRPASLAAAPAPAPSPLYSHVIDNRKSILVNGYPVVTCYGPPAPGSPSARPKAPAPPAPNAIATAPNRDPFQYELQNGRDRGRPEPSPIADSHSDATSQWVDDSFPQPDPLSPERPYPYPPSSTTKRYDDNDTMERSLNSSESSFNALSVSQYDRCGRFDSGIDTEHPDSESRSPLADLMTRITSATISTSTDLIENLSSRTVKAEIRTSIVSISSSRIEKKRPERCANVSLSTLSVNSADTSASDRSSSQDVNVTERRLTPPLALAPTAPVAPAKSPYTGAIPKSISFDASAEKTQRRRAEEEEPPTGVEDMRGHAKRSGTGGSLLHKIKMFRQRGRASHNQHHHPETRTTGDERPEEVPRAGAATADSSEDILAKYRQRRRSSADSCGGQRAAPPLSDVELDTRYQCEGVVDLNDPEVFDSMKRKLRVVLSDPDLWCAEYLPNRCTSTSLVDFVRAAAACAASEGSAVHAGELARALAGAGGGGGSASGDSACARLAAALRADLSARRPYASYLASCRAALTHTLHSLRRQVEYVRSEWRGCARTAAAARALEQLERSASLRRLARHHHPHNNTTGAGGAVGGISQTQGGAGELIDEKASRLAASIRAITSEVKADPSWEGAAPALLETVEVTVERAAFARLYLQVLFPNGEGDIARDLVLSEHIRRLASWCSAARVGVPPRHLWAAPYTRAQLVLHHLGAYRTPRDKLTCVVRCLTSLMAVLGLTEGAAPSADDLTPVLVYVIIKVNPASLLSTIEMVNALGGVALQGEVLYWWTQFSAAVAYIKTMDYPRQRTHPRSDSSAGADT